MKERWNIDRERGLKGERRKGLEKKEEERREKEEKEI